MALSATCPCVNTRVGAREGFCTVRSGKTESSRFKRADSERLNGKKVYGRKHTGRAETSFHVGGKEKDETNCEYDNLGTYQVCYFKANVQVLTTKPPERRPAIRPGRR